MSAPAMKTISIPVHPDEERVPYSIVYFPVAGGKYVQIVGPLAPKTLTALITTLEACKEMLVARPDDYSI